MSAEIHEVDVVVVGAGVVGLAVARAFALAGREVLVLEREGHIAEHQSSRNSEVIHAGIYYAPGSLKAATCIAGKAMLYDYCAARGVPHRALGKIVVATSAAQEAKLLAIRDNAHACGMDAIDLAPRAEVAAWEPALAFTQALWSPSSGIVDSHAYMLALIGDIEGAGGGIVFHAPVEGATPAREGIEVRVGGAEPARLAARLLVNCGGLFAPALARSVDGFPTRLVPDEGFARGNYFTLTGKAPFSRLVYPVPEPGGLGVHLTLDLGGQARFGPDVEWIEGVDYRVDPARAARFYGEIRRYWPGLPDASLAPAYAGIRAKIGPRDQTQDFMVSTAAEHGMAGVVHLFGIESPGLTASLALADHVVRRVAALG